MDFIRQKTIPPIIFISERVCLRCTLHGYYSKTASFFDKFLKSFGRAFGEFILWRRMELFE